MRTLARRLVRDYAALVTGELASKAAGFLAFAYLARTLGPELYGAVELAVVLALVFALVVDFGLGPIGAREVVKQPGRAPALAFQITATRLLLALPAVAVMSATALLIAPSPAGRRLALLFALSLFATPWTLNWLLQGLNRMLPAAVATALRMTVFLAGVGLLVEGPADLHWVGVAEIAAVAAMACYYVTVSWRRLAQLRPPPPEGAASGAPPRGAAPGPWKHLGARTLGRLLRAASPVAASQLLWALNQTLALPLLAVLAASRELALFGAAHRIVISLNSFIWLYFFNLYPVLTRATTRTPAPPPGEPAGGAGPGFSTVTRTSFQVTSWGGVLVALAGTLLAGPLCRLAFGDAFAAAGEVFAVLVWVLPIHLLSGHARFSLIAAGHQRDELLAQAAGLAVTAGAGIPSIAAWGMRGAAAAMVLSGGVVWLVAHSFARRRIGPLPSLAPAWRPAAAALAAAGLSTWLLPAGWGRGLAATTLYALAAVSFAPRLAGRLAARLRGAAAAPPRDGNDRRHG